MPKIRKTQNLEIVVKIAVLSVVVRILVKNFLPHEIDDNGHFCLKNDCPGWLVKIQEQLGLQVKISWVAAVTTPGGLKFLLFCLKKGQHLISLSISSKPIQ